MALREIIEQAKDEMKRPDKQKGEGASKDSYSRLRETIRAAGGMPSYAADNKKKQDEWEEKHPVLTTIRNIPGSAGQAAANIAEPIAELGKYGWDVGRNYLGFLNEPETPSIIKGLKGLGGDIVKSSGIYKDYTNQQAYLQDKKLPYPMKGKNMMEQYGSDKQDLKYAKAFFDYYKDRYGGWKEFKKTLIKDPVGTLLDAMVIPGGPQAVKAIIPLAKQIPGASQAAGKISAAAKALGKGAASIPGITTGAEKGGVINATKSIFSKDPEARKLFADTIKGKVSEEDIFKSVKDAVDKISEQRRIEYREAFGKLKDANMMVDIFPLQADMSRLMREFNIYPKKKGKASLEDFSPRPSSTSIVRKVMDRFNRFVNNPSEHTLVGLDDLKKFVGEAFLPSEQAEKGAAFSNALKNNINSHINMIYPEYSEMTKAYAESRKFQRVLEKELSMGNRANIGTALKKLNTALKDSNSYRSDLLGKLEEQAGKSLMPAISALPFKSVEPHGLMGRSIGLSELVGMWSHPSVVAGMFISSPRLFSETMRTIEKGKRIGGKAAGKAFEYPRVGGILQNIGGIPLNITGGINAGQEGQAAP